MATATSDGRYVTITMSDADGWQHVIVLRKPDAVSLANAVAQATECDDETEVK